MRIKSQIYILFFQSSEETTVVIHLHFAGFDEGKNHHGYSCVYN